MWRATKGILWVVSLGTLLSGTGRAQDVGNVARIAEEQGMLVESTRWAEIWHASQLPSQVRKKDRVAIRDIVRLRRRITVELDINRPDLVTKAFLGSHKLSAVGGYEILPGSLDKLSALQLVVKQGVLVVEHARGQLMAVACSTRVKVIGTTVLFQVDSLTQTGTVFLLDGHISYVDYDMDETGQNRAWRVKPGQRPQEFVPTGGELKQWRHEVDYATHTVWRSTPFWQKPSFLLPAAAVVAGAVGCAAAGCFSGGDGSSVGPPGTSRGGIDVTIP
jgi:hypothetical protein